MGLSASEERAASVELLCKNARGNISKTVSLIDLKIAQWDSKPKTTLYTKFHRNPRDRVFWPGRFVPERHRYDVIFYLQFLGVLFIAKEN